MTAEDRGDTDVQKLLVFVVGIAVVLAVVPAALGFAGIDIRNASLGDGPTADGDGPEDDSMIVLSAFGSDINDDRTTVGVVEVLVTPVGESVDVTDVTVSWDGRDRYELTPSAVGAGDASFDVQAVGDGSDTLGPSDRALLRFDLGSADVEGLQRFGDRLEPGDSVTLTIRTSSGGETSETITVPDPLPPGPAVRFV